MQRRRELARPVNPDDGGQRDGEKPSGERQGGCAAGAVVYELRTRPDGERGQRETADQAEARDEFAHGAAPDASPRRAATPRTNPKRRASGGVPN